MKMVQLHLTQCCCGCSLQTGSLIFGYFGLIFFVGVLTDEISGFLKGEVNPLLADNDTLGREVSRMLIIIYTLCFMADILLLYGAHKQRKNLILPAVLATFCGILMTILGGFAWGAILVHENNKKNGGKDEGPDGDGDDDGVETAGGEDYEYYDDGGADGELYGLLTMAVVISMLMTLLQIYIHCVVKSYWQELKSADLQVNGNTYTEVASSHLLPPPQTQLPPPQQPQQHTKLPHSQSLHNHPPPPPQTHSSHHSHPPPPQQPIPHQSHHLSQPPQHSRHSTPRHQQPHQSSGHHYPQHSHHSSRHSSSQQPPPPQQQQMVSYYRG